MRPRSAASTLIFVLAAVAVVVALVSVGADGEDGRSALGALRATLAALGADILTTEFRLPSGSSAFDTKGKLLDPAARARLDDLLDRLLDASRALGRQGG